MNYDQVTILTHREAAGVHTAVAGRYTATSPSPMLAARLVASKHFDAPEDQVELTLLAHGVLIAEIGKPTPAKPGWLIRLQGALIIAVGAGALWLAWLYAQGGPR